MERYIGLDVHRESTTAVALTSRSRKPLWTRVVTTTAGELIDLVCSVPRPRQVCLEEGTQSEWLYEILAPHADEVVVVLPGKRTRTVNKDDAHDALNLAVELRNGTPQRRVFKNVGAMTGLREAVRTYQKLTEDSTRTQNRILAALRSRGVATSWGMALDADLLAKALRKLPPKFRPRLELLMQELAALLELRSTAETQLLAEAKQQAAVKLLESLPGIGPLRAAIIVAVVVDPRRFRTKRQLWSYSGLAIMTSTSAQWTKHEGQWVRQNAAMPRGLNRNRNPWLKNVFSGAAHTVITQMPSHPLHQAYLRLLDNGTKPNLAKLTIARRIAAACLAIWKHKEAYDPEKHRSNTAA